MQRRKNYLIKKRFQMNFAAKFIILLILESALIIGLFMFISQDTLTTGYYNSILRIERTQSFFIIPMVLLTLIIVIGLGLTGLVVFTLLSHKIAGPMYRFEAAMKQIEEGDLASVIRLRENDQLTDVLDSLNRMASALGQRLTRIKKAANEARDLLDRDRPPEAEDRLKAQMGIIRDELEHFQLPPEQP